jgi:hypothetical protein
LTGQRSMVNFDRAETGPRWAWAGPDMGRTGPGWAGHVSDAGAATSSTWILKRARAGELGSRWTHGQGSRVQARSRVDRVHFPPPLFGSPALGAPSSAAAPPSPSLFHGRASAGDERLVPAPRRLNNGAQGLYGFARTPGTRRWGPGGGLEFPVGLSTARCAAVFRCAQDEGEARRGRDYFIHLLGDGLRAYDVTLNGASLLCKAAGVG